MIILMMACTKGLKNPLHGIVKYLEKNLNKELRKEVIDKSHIVLQMTVSKAMPNFFYEACKTKR